MTSRIIVAIVAVFAVVLFGGCGEGGDSPTGPTTPSVDPLTPVTPPPPTTPTRLTRSNLNGMTLTLTPRLFQCHDGTTADGTRTRRLRFQGDVVTFLNTGTEGTWDFYNPDGVHVESLPLASEGELGIYMDFLPVSTHGLDLFYDSGIWRRGSYQLYGERRDIDFCEQYSHNGSYRFEE